MSYAKRVAEMSTFRSDWEWWLYASRFMGRYVFGVSSLVGALTGWAVGANTFGVGAAIALAVLWFAAFLVSAWHVWRTAKWTWGLLCCAPMIAVVIASPGSAFLFGLYFLFLAIVGGAMLILRVKTGPRP